MSETARPVREAAINDLENVCEESKESAIVVAAVVLLAAVLRDGNGEEAIKALAALAT